jgi:hypothetical protein
LGVGIRPPPSVVPPGPRHGQSNRGHVIQITSPRHAMLGAYAFVSPMLALGIVTDPRQRYRNRRLDAAEHGWHHADCFGFYSGQPDPFLPDFMNRSQVTPQQPEACRQLSLFGGNAGGVIAVFSPSFCPSVGANIISAKPISGISHVDGSWAAGARSKHRLQTASFHLTVGAAPVVHFVSCASRYRL